MIVTVINTGKAAVRDLHDFHHFHVEAAFDRQELAKLQAGPVSFEGQDTAWVDIGWLLSVPGLADRADRLAAFDGMLSYARPRGWVDPDRGAIRAHVEWV